MSMQTPPVEIRLRTRSARLALRWDDGSEHSLSFEYLRVQSPSAEVRGHHPDQAVLQSGKRDVRITRIAPVGHYALKFVFSDGHDSGIYSWAYLRELGDHYEQRWQQYLDALSTAGLRRDR